MKLDDVQRAAELQRRGYGTSEIAKEIGYSRSTVIRAKASRPDLFEEHDPGSIEHRRAILLQALESGNLAERLRAVELLERLGANEKPQGSQTIYVVDGYDGDSLDVPCRKCGASIRVLGMPESTEVEPDDVPGPRDDG